MGKSKKVKDQKDIKNLGKIERRQKKVLWIGLRYIKIQIQTNETKKYQCRMWNTDETETEDTKRRWRQTKWEKHKRLYMDLQGIRRKKRQQTEEKEETAD